MLSWVVSPQNFWVTARDKMWWLKKKLNNCVVMKLFALHTQFPGRKSYLILLDLHPRILWKNSPRRMSKVPKPELSNVPEELMLGIQLQWRCEIIAWVCRNTKTLKFKVRKIVGIEKLACRGNPIEKTGLIRRKISIIVFVPVSCSWGQVGASVDWNIKSFHL